MADGQRGNRPAPRVHWRISHHHGGACGRCGRLPHPFQADVVEPTRRLFGPAPRYRGGSRVLPMGMGGVGSGGRSRSLSVDAAWLGPGMAAYVAILLSASTGRVRADSCDLHVCRSPGARCGWRGCIRRDLDPAPERSFGFPEYPDQAQSQSTSHSRPCSAWSL